MITTDGHRLCFTETDIKTDQTVDVLVPRKALSEILKIDAEEFNFGVTPNHVFFSTAQESIVSRRLTGTFPNYELVLPKDSDRKLTVTLPAIKSAVKRVALMSDERLHGIKLDVSPAEILVRATSSELGEGEEAIAAEYDGEPITISFDWHYLSDFLAVADTDKSVEMHFKDANAQTDWRIEGAGGSGTS